MRNSLTRRSCKVLLARSTRPFACGVLAQRMSMLSACRERPNCVMPPAFAGAGSALDCPGGIDPKDAVLVAVERDRLTMRLEILAGRLEVVEGRFRLDQLQVHQAAGGVVDIHKQGGL